MSATDAGTDQPPGRGQLKITSGGDTVNTFVTVDDVELTGVTAVEWRIAVGGHGEGVRFATATLTVEGVPVEVEGKLVDAPREGSDAA